MFGRGPPSPPAAYLLAVFSPGRFRRCCRVDSRWSRSQSNFFGRKLPIKAVTGRKPIYTPSGRKPIFLVDKGTDSTVKVEIHHSVFHSQAVDRSEEHTSE